MPTDVYCKVDNCDIYIFVIIYQNKCEYYLVSELVEELRNNKAEIYELLFKEKYTTCDKDIYPNL